MLKVILIAAGIAILGCIPFMGLPGALATTVAKPTTNLIYGTLAWEAWSSKLGDRAWPLAILVTLIWPIVIPAAWLVRARIWPDATFFSAKPFAVFATIVVVGFIIAGQIAIIMSGSVKRLSREEIVRTAVDVGALGVFKNHFDKSDLGRLAKDPLQDAIFNRHIALATFLIEQRDSFDAYVPPGHPESGQFASPLQTAVNVGSVELVRLLLAKGANPNATNTLGQSPVFALSWKPDGDGEVVRQLKGAGADFSLIDKNGETPLIAMTRNVLNSWDQMRDYAKLLVDGGADPAHCNNDGKSALDFARENHHRTTIEYLESLAK